MLEEIMQMPEKARLFQENAAPYNLPLNVPYLGMGSSYFAALAFKYMGIDIRPEIASEFFTYLSKPRIPLGVILSQSGRSSEALWCTALFDKYIAVSNHLDSPLCTRENVSEKIPLLAGEELYSSSKTYLNTLLCLFKGFGMDVSGSVRLLMDNMDKCAATGEQLASQVFELITNRNIHGIYITGSGPNIATAMQAGLILSESTKRSFQGLAMAQYDHGPKETAVNSIVIQILTPGASYARGRKLSETMRSAGAQVLVVEEDSVDENSSVLNNIIPFNFMCYYLSKLLNIGEMFVVGGKVTEVS